MEKFVTSNLRKLKNNRNERTSHIQLRYFSQLRNYTSKLNMSAWFLGLRFRQKSSKNDETAVNFSNLGDLWAATTFR